jgi:hypothetical protein
VILKSGASETAPLPSRLKVASKWFGGQDGLDSLPHTRGGVEAKLSEAFAHARDVPDNAAVPRDFHAYELSPDDLAY